MIHVGDHGTLIRLVAPVDIAGGTYAILYRDPTGRSGVWTASLNADGRTIEYTTIAGDVNAVGLWRLQGRCTYAAAVFHTSKVDLTVEPTVAG